MCVKAQGDRQSIDACETENEFSFQHPLKLQVSLDMMFPDKQRTLHLITDTFKPPERAGHRSVQQMPLKRELNSAFYYFQTHNKRLCLNVLLIFGQEQNILLAVK